MDNDYKILLLEDVGTDAELIERELHQAGIPFTARVVQTKEDYLRELEEHPPDLILADYKLPQFDGIFALSMLQERSPHTPFIFVSGAISEDLLIEALRCGAKDYVLKDKMERLVPVVKRALHEAEEEADLELAQQMLHAREEQFRLLMENLGDVFWIATPEMVVRYMSPAYEKVWGRSIGDLYVNSSQWIDALHPEDRQHFLDDAHSNVNNGEPWEGEYRIVQPDGSIHWVYARGYTVRDDDGNVVHQVGTAMDITAKKQGKGESRRKKMAAIQP